MIANGWTHLVTRQNFFSQRSKGAGNEMPAVAKAKGTDEKR
jgi:hypothetical protein